MSGLSTCFLLGITIPTALIPTEKIRTRGRVPFVAVGIVLLPALFRPVAPGLRWVLVRQWALVLTWVFRTLVLRTGLEIRGRLFPRDLSPNVYESCSLFLLWSFCACFHVANTTESNRLCTGYPLCIMPLRGHNALMPEQVGHILQGHAILQEVTSERVPESVASHASFALDSPRRVKHLPQFPGPSGVRPVGCYRSPAWASKRRTRGYRWQP